MISPTCSRSQTSTMRWTYSSSQAYGTACTLSQRWFPADTGTVFVPTSRTSGATSRSTRRIPWPTLPPTPVTATVVISTRAKLDDGLDDLQLILLRQVVVEGKSHEAVGDVFGDRKRCWRPRHTLAHCRSVEWLVMEDGEDVALAKMFEEARPRIQRRQQQVVQVVGLITLVRHDRTRHP